MQRFVHMERQSLPFIEFFFPFNFIIRRILLIDQAGKKVENQHLEFLKLKFNSKSSFKNSSSRLLTEEENTEKKKKRRRLVVEDQIIHQHQIAHPDRFVLLPSSPTRSSSSASSSVLCSSGFVFLQVRQKSSL